MSGTWKKIANASPAKVGEYKVRRNAAHGDDTLWTAWWGGATWGAPTRSVEGTALRYFNDGQRDMCGATEWLDTSVLKPTMEDEYQRKFGTRNPGYNAPCSECGKLWQSHHNDRCPEDAKKEKIKRIVGRPGVYKVKCEDKSAVYYYITAAGDLCGAYTVEEDARIREKEGDRGVNMKFSWDKLTNIEFIGSTASAHKPGIYQVVWGSHDGNYVKSSDGEHCTPRTHSIEGARDLSSHEQFDMWSGSPFTKPVWVAELKPKEERKLGIWKVSTIAGGTQYAYWRGKDWSYFSPTPEELAESGYKTSSSHHPTDSLTAIEFIGEKPKPKAEPMPLPSRKGIYKVMYGGKDKYDNPGYAIWFGEYWGNSWDRPEDISQQMTSKGSMEIIAWSWHSELTAPASKADAKSVASAVHSRPARTRGDKRLIL